MANRFLVPWGAGMLLELPVEADLEEIRQPCHSLRRLILPGNTPRIGERLLNHFLEMMPDLICLTADIGLPARLLSNLNHKFVELDFSRSDIGDLVMTQFLEKSSSSLQKLILGECFDLTGKTWTAISKCSELRHLDVSHCRDLREDHLRDILLNAVHLEYLDVSGLRGFNFEGINPIPDLKSLRHFSATYYHPNIGGILKLLERTSTLLFLQMSRTNELVTNSPRIASLKNLRSLVLYDELAYNYVTPECFAIICDNFRQLELLVLGSIPELTDVDAEKFGQLEHLKELKFSHAERFSDGAYKRGFGASTLERLMIRFTPLTSVALAGIAARHARLKRLELSNCDEITDEGLKNLLRCEPQLEFIALRSCCKLTDESLRAFECSCPVLNYISIRWPHQLSKDGVSRLKNLRPQVEFFAEFCRLRE